MTDSTTASGGLDDLLEDLPTTTTKTVSAESVDISPSDAAARIAALEAQLAAAEYRAEVAEKSPEQKTLEHSQALRQTEAVLAAPEQFESLDGDEVITIHILESGFTFADRVWQYGQTVQFKRSGKAYQESLNRRGVSWLDDLSPQTQLRRWKKIVVGEGPYTGPAFNDAVSEEDRRRGNAAPLVVIN